MSSYYDGPSASVGMKRSLSESSTGSSSCGGGDASTVQSTNSAEDASSVGGGPTSGTSASQYYRGVSSSDGRPPFKIPKKTDLMGLGTFAGRRESQASSASSSADGGTAASSSAVSTSSADDDEESSTGGAGFESPPPNNGGGTFYGGFSPPPVAAAAAPAMPSVAPKMARADEKGEYSSFAQKMMSKMGYKEGSGLGKGGQGILEPVGMSKQRGRRGLGMIVKGLEEEKVEWDPDSEHVVVKEAVEWMPDCREGPPRDMHVLRSWMREGSRKLDISDEDRFCDPEVLSSVLRCKTIFDRLEPEELRKARTRSNPFETIRGAFFLNRAAMKMANMDAVFDFMFSRPKTPKGAPAIQGNQLLYFADVCAGPGGFSEYVLWRAKGWRARGFGFTLKGPCDFKLEDFFAGSAESFETHYGVGGREGDGNIFDEGNVRTFERHVLENTEGKGVHFMMADGGFSVEGQENEQEILSKQLYLCQFLVALGIVREGGHFVCKLFDLFTPFSVGLLYLMRRCFERVCIHKPNTSRPANSERYIICKWKRPDTCAVHDYMLEVSARLNQIGLDILGKTDSDVDVSEIVPLEEVMADQELVDYITNSNNVLGERQIVGLAKIAAFCKDSTLYEHRQGDIKEACLAEWRVPNDVRKAPAYERPQAKLDTLLGRRTADFLGSPATALTPENLESKVRSAYDFKFVMLGSDPEAAGGGPSFFLGLGRSKIFKLVMRGQKQHWEKVDESQTKFDLPPGTLVLAETVTEVRGEGRSSRKMAAVHVVDVAFVAGEDLTGMDVKARADVAAALCRSMNKPTRVDQVRLRPKELFGLDRLPAVLASLQPRMLKSGGPRPRLTHPVQEPNGEDDSGHPRYFVPTGLLLFRLVRDPFMLALSKSQKRKYWFNSQTRASAFECPKGASPDLPASYSQRLHWPWDRGVRVRSDLPELHPSHQRDGDPGRLHGDRIVAHVQKLLK